MKILMALAVVAATAGGAQAATVFSDDFSGYGPNTVLSAPNAVFAPNWTALSGTVDYLASGSAYGNLCNTGTNCVDLDGSTGQGGVFATVKSFAAGTYKLSVAIFGNRRGAGDDIVTIVLGSFSKQLDLSSWEDGSAIFKFTTTGGQLSFANGGGDNQGAILQGVELAAVPVPAAAPLLAGGIGALVALRKRRKA
ncbi:MAG: pyruvate-binding protein [Cereibacter sphaeroides]|uniref:Pyruvate-binding protein n=1 Tax=Cereibacter sphaeroides TaxID=1063 RepID=A0A2W5SFG9_CERSP|nr:MAG: pyruvate-binding protein [Cereibacter sphaeroides]